MNNFFKAVSLLLICLIILSCEQPSKDSDQIDTQKIFIKAQLTSHNDYTHVEVNLYEDREFGDPLKLTDGEYMTVSFLGKTVELEQSNNSLQIDYEANIDNFNLDGLYTVTLFRSDGTFVSSTINMLPSFTITSPRADSTYSEIDNISLNWDASVYQGNIEFYRLLRCWNWDDDGDYDADNESENITLEDDGSYVFNMVTMADSIRLESWLEDDQIDYSRPCEFSLSLIRETKQDLSDTYAEGSYIKALQFREVADMFVVIFEK